jgi:phosphoenolpyruvate-protein phosphotransferase (PTS system enzyme I)
MAGDPLYTWILLGLGVRELSMSPRYIPAVKSVIAGTGLAEAQALTAEAMTLRSDSEVEELVVASMQRRFPLELAPGQ